MSENEVSSESFDWTSAAQEGSFPDDVYWVFQALSKVKSKDDIELVADGAPSPGALVLLEYALDQRRDFMTNILMRTLNRTSKESAMRDDGRRIKIDEIRDEILDRLDQKYQSKSQCPMCGRKLTKHTVLFRGAEKPN